MTREQARKAAEVMLAYADGKTIECLADDEIGWVTVVKSASFNWCDCDYRIKGSPKYRPFKDSEECWNEMLKYQPFGWVKHISTGDVLNIRRLTNLDIITTCTTKYTAALREVTFADGEPFGIKE